MTVESIDPYGLAAEQKNIRVRGVHGFLGAMTVAGVPNYGGNPMGPREYIYDTENFDSIAVYKGAVDCRPVIDIKPYMASYYGVKNTTVPEWMVPLPRG